MKITKRELYSKLKEELNDALPQIAHDCDVDIDEALCDKWSKDYDNFHLKSREIVEYKEVAPDE